MGMVPHYDESTLIPSLPYFDLPAGLMVPLVKMEDSGYKPLDPKKIRQVIKLQLPGGFVLRCIV